MTEETEEDTTSTHTVNARRVWSVQIENGFGQPIYIDTYFDPEEL